MIKAKVTVSQRITTSVVVEADSYDELYQEAKSYLGSCIAQSYDDYDDYNCENIDIIDEWEDEDDY